MEFPKLWVYSILSVALVASIVGCKSAPAPARNSSAPKITVQQAEDTEPSEKSTDKDCGLTGYPISRSNEEILSDVHRDPKKPPTYSMLAKVAINKEGKITHLRVLSLAHSNAPNWMEINETALASIEKRAPKPTLYQGKPVAVCSDVSVVVDLR